MLVFNPGRLTAAGKNLLAEVQGGAEKITFTKFVFGSGSYSSSENIADRTSLKEPKQEFPVSSRTVENKSTVTLLCILTNKASDDDILTEGYTIREVGLYARNAAGDEILYCLSTAATTDMMPAYDGHSVSRANITYTIEVGDADSVEIVSQGAYASAEDLIKITARVEKLEKSVGTLQNSNLASEVGAFGVRYWNKKWQVKNADGTYENAASGGIAPDAMKSFKAVGGNGLVKLYIDEPGDTVIDGHTLVRVAGVAIVRKDTKYPATEEAGIRVIDIPRADFGKYKSEPYVDSDLTNGKIYYYSAFPYSDGSVYNYDESNRASATPKEYELYGYDEDQNDSNPATRISYPDDVDNAGFTPISVDTTNGGYSAPDWEDTFIFKGVRPVMLKFDGTVDYELNHDDQTKKLDGTASDISNQSYEGDAMTEFSKMYFRRWTDNNNVKHVRVSDKKVDQNFHCYQHMNGPDSEIDKIYLPMFEGSVINGKMRSIAGVAPTSNTTGAQEISYCAAKGAGHQLDDWANTMMVENLLFLIGKSTDVQKTYGNGHYSGGTSASSLLQTGTLKNKGMFWGSTGNVAVKVFWLENYYGDRWDRKYGCVTDANGQVLVKMFPPYNTDGSGYTATGVTPTGTSGGYISKTKLGDFGDIPTEVNGSETTNIPDGCWFAAGCFLVWGGGCDCGLHVGVAFSVYNAVSHSNWLSGGSPAYKSPLAA